MNIFKRNFWFLTRILVQNLSYPPCIYARKLETFDQTCDAIWEISLPKYLFYFSFPVCKNKTLHFVQVCSSQLHSNRTQPITIEFPTEIIGTRAGLSEAPGYNWEMASVQVNWSVTKLISFSFIKYKIFYNSQFD